LSRQRYTYGAESTARPWAAVVHRSRASGGSEVMVECPFDGTRFWAFIWSISGSGKKCPTCGARHGRSLAYPTNAWLAANPGPKPDSDQS
jgi:hypothetical protein